MFMQSNRIYYAKEVPNAKEGHILALAPEMPVLAQKRVCRSKAGRTSGTVYFLRNVRAADRREKEINLNPCCVAAVMNKQTPPPRKRWGFIFYEMKLMFNQESKVMKKVICVLFFCTALMACDKNNDEPEDTGTTTISGCMDVNAYNYNNNATEDCCCQYECDGVNTLRVGAVCNDGTTSTATGSGACSHHDGVNYWLCK